MYRLTHIRLFATLFSLVFVAYAYSQERSLPCAKVDLTLAFDLSGSMSSQYQKLIMKEALRAFAGYKVNLNSLGIGIVVFSGTAKQVQAITFNEEELKFWENNFPKIEISGSILETGLNAVKSQHINNIATYPNRLDSHKIAIIFTDGEECPVNSSETGCEGREQAEYNTIRIAEELRHGFWTTKEGNNDFTLYTVAIPDKYFMEKYLPTGKQIVRPERESPFHRPGKKGRMLPADTIPEIKLMKIEITDDTNIQKDHLENIVGVPENVIITNFKLLFDELENLNICG